MIGSTLLALTSFCYGNNLVRGQNLTDENEKSDMPGDAKAYVLSIQTLFHPEEKKDFDSKLPATHWIDNSHNQTDDLPSTLLIRRDNRWMQVNLDSLGTSSTHETPWPITERLAGQLRLLDGLDADRASKIAIRAVTNLKTPTDSVLIKIGKALAIASADQPARWLTQDGAGWKNATLDPTASRVAYTRDDDLFVVDVQSGLTMRLTDDASDTLLDGVLDWTYQEEIFGRGNYKGFWFSPDGQWLAMLRIDISQIEPYLLSSSSNERGSGMVRRYSKAGDAIPQASLYLWDLRQSDSGEVPAPRLIEQSTPQNERLITGVWWHPDRQKLLYAVSDRLQTWREVRSIGQPFLSGKRNESDLLMREASPAWVEPPSNPVWLGDESFLWLSEIPSGRSRLYHVSPDGSVVRPISPEKFDVDSFNISADGKEVFVSGDVDQGTVQHQLYRLDLIPESASPGSPNIRPSQSTLAMAAVTESWGWHETELSPDGKWFLDRHSHAHQPPSLRIRSVDGHVNQLLAESDLRTRQPIIEPTFFQIPASDSVQLPAMLVKPSFSNDAEPRRCPVVIEIYGGPRAPVVSSQWSGTKTLYRELLARRGIATLVVDNRSSAGRGIADTWPIRGQLGQVEMKDLQTAVDWLRLQPWADPDRVAIRGWSFGGFLTLYAMTHSHSFAAGIAGGSVTDWKEYDSIYTERYMRAPAENPDGYAAASPIGTAGNLHGKLLMIHGEADDNVHPSNTLRMAAALQKAGKDFQMMIYPGAAHAVNDPWQAWHMAQMTDRFLMESLGVEPD